MPRARGAARETAQRRPEATRQSRDRGRGSCRILRHLGGSLRSKGPGLEQGFPVPDGFWGKSALFSVVMFIRRSPDVFGCLFRSRRDTGRRVSGGEGPSPSPS